VPHDFAAFEYSSSIKIKMAKINVLTGVISLKLAI